MTGDKARVETSESWSQFEIDYTGTVVYKLERDGRAWVITDYDVDIDDTDEPEDTDGAADPDDAEADAAVASDLANAKIALFAYFIDTGSFADVDTADLSSYGYTRGDSTDEIHYYIADPAVAEFCVDATSTSGSDFVITDSTPVGDGLCEDVDPP